MPTPSRLPWVAATVAIVLIWCMWSLEMPATMAGSATAKTIQLVYSQAEDEAIRLALEAAGNEEPQSPASIAAPDSAPTPVHTDIPSETTRSASSGRPLVLYAYSESTNALFNLQFFIDHGLHAAADFVFILNGRTTATSLIPDRPNIRYVQRANDCYDLGAYAEVLTGGDLYKKYNKFIMLNASIRGPFLPYWSEGCWTDMYLSRITEEVKLVGMTANCWPSLHVQSMIWATDIIGLEILLNPPAAITSSLTLNPTYDPLTETETGVKLPPHYSGINSCFHTWGSAVAAEIGSSAVIQAAGYKLDVMMSAYHAVDNYEEICDKTRETADVLWDRQYFGMNVHPFETVFMKSNRDVDPVTIDRLTQWTMSRGFSSYDHCKA